MILLLFLLDHLIRLHVILQFIGRLRHNRFAAILFALIYIADYSTLPLFFFPIASGAIFGFSKGVLIANIAENLGALIPFLVIRKFSRRHASATVPLAEQSKYLDPALGNFWSVLVARFIGLPHYVVINYAAAFSSIHLRKYIAANFLGMLLWLVSITYFSDRLWTATIKGGEAAFRHKLLVALLPLLVIKALTLIILYFMKRKKESRQRS